MLKHILVLIGIFSPIFTHAADRVIEDFETMVAKADVVARISVASSDKLMLTYDGRQEPCGGSVVVANVLELLKGQAMREIEFYWNRELDAAPGSEFLLLAFRRSSSGNVLPSHGTDLEGARTLCRLNSGEYLAYGMPNTLSPFSPEAEARLGGKWVVSTGEEAFDHAYLPRRQLDVSGQSVHVVEWSKIKSRIESSLKRSSPQPGP